MFDDISWKPIPIPNNHVRHPGSGRPMGHLGLGDGDDEQLSVYCERQRFSLMDAGRPLLRPVVPLQGRPTRIHSASELARVATGIFIHRTLWPFSPRPHPG